MAITEEQEMAMLRERIRFEMMPRTYNLEAVIADERLADELRGECEISGNTLEGALSELCSLINCTKHVTFSFKGDESPLLIEFKKRMETAQADGGAAWWSLRLWMDIRFLRIWREEYDAATKRKPLFAAPAEQLPDEALTPSQRKEAADPASPLAKPASASAKK